MGAVCRLAVGVAVGVTTSGTCPPALLFDLLGAQLVRCAVCGVEGVAPGSPALPRQTPGGWCPRGLKVGPSAARPVPHLTSLPLLPDACWQSRV